MATESGWQRVTAGLREGATRDEYGMPSGFWVRGQGGPRGHWFTAYVSLADGVMLCERLNVAPAVDGAPLDSAAGLRVPLHALLREGAAQLQGIEYQSAVTGRREVLPPTRSEKEHAQRRHSALDDRARLEAFAQAWRRARAAHPLSVKAAVSSVGRELGESRSNVYRLRDAAVAAGLLDSASVARRPDIESSPDLQERIVADEERQRVELEAWQSGRRQFAEQQRKNLQRRRAEAARTTKSSKQQRRGKQQ